MKINLPFSNKQYGFSSGYLLFFFAAWSLWWSFYAIWLKTKLGLTGSELGMLYSVNNASGHGQCVVVERGNRRKILVGFLGGNNYLIIHPNPVRV